MRPSPALVVALAPACALLAACDAAETPRTEPAASAASVAAAPSGRPAPAAGGVPNDSAGAGAPLDSFPASRFVLAERGRVIVRVDSAGSRAVRTPIFGVQDVPAEWEPSPEARFGVGGDSLHFAVPSPGGGHVAWQAGSTHALLGIVDAGGRRRATRPVLDFFWDSRASTVSWSPGGRYLLARYTGPSGTAEARVYDVPRGTRLRAPWEDACGPGSACQVTDARWAGPTTLRVTTRAPGAAPRTFTADAAQLPAHEPPRAR